MGVSLDFTTKDEYLEFVMNKFNMRELIYNAIDLAYFEGLDIAVVFESYVEETGQTSTHVIQRETWIFSLNQVLKASEEIEDYEYCEMVYTLIKELEECL